MSTPSRSTLERAFDKVPRFLRAIARHRAVSTAMTQVGYTNADQQEGWDLLHRAAGTLRHTPPVAGPIPSADAIVELDAWDETGYAIARAALERRHPEQAAFVFEGLKAEQGPEAVIGVRTFLQRLEALEAAPERAETREADQAALATLATRGIDAAERARLASLVATASDVAPVMDAPPNDDVEAALLALYAWYKEWSETARAVIKSRRQLIYLGLANPRRARVEPEAFDPATVV